jgi:MFS family permease
VLGGLVAFSSAPGQSFVFSVFIDDLIEDTGLNRTAISLLYAVGTGISAFMVFTVSRLADRFGARTTLISAALGLGLACFAMSQAREALVIFVAFAALRALGQGSLTINATLLTAQWFIVRRGQAMAIMGLGFPLSLAILPPVCRALIDSIGWRETYMILGAMVWLLVLPPAIFVAKERPEDVGLYPDGAAQPPARESAARALGHQAPAAVLTSVRFWLLAIPLATPGLITTGLIFHQTAIMQEQGLSPAVAAGIFVPIAACSAGMSLISGWAVDRTGPKPVFTAGMTTLTLAMLLLLLVNSLVMAIVYAMFIGLTQGATRIVNSVIWAHFYGRIGLGRVQGSAVMVGITGSALGPLPLAWLAGRLGGFEPAVLVMSLLPLVAIGAVAIARPPTNIALAGDAFSYHASQVT